MLRVLLVASLASMVAARLLHKSQAKMRVATRLLPVQIPLQVPMLVPMGTPLDQAGPFPQGPFAQVPMLNGGFVLNAGPGPEMDEMEIPPMNMDAAFGGGFMATPGFQPSGMDVGQLRQLMSTNEAGDEQNSEDEAVAQSSSSSISRQQNVETLKNGTRQVRTTVTTCKNGKCEKKESVQVIKPNKKVDTAASKYLKKADQSEKANTDAEQKTIPAANVGPSAPDAVFAAGAPSIQDVLNQVMGFGREIGAGVETPRFPFGAEGLKIKMPRGPGAPAAPLSLEHLDDQDHIQGTLPTGLNASDLKVDQSGHVVTVQYRMKNGPSTVGVEQRFSLDFAPAQKPKAKYYKKTGKFSLEIPRPVNAKSSSSDVEVVMDDHEEEPGEATSKAVAAAKKATHIAQRKHQKQVEKQSQELQNAKQHLQAALDPQAEPIIMLEFSS